MRHSAHRTPIHSTGMEGEEGDEEEEEEEEEEEDGPRRQRRAAAKHSTGGAARRMSEVGVFDALPLAEWRWWCSGCVADGRWSGSQRW